jgi:arsenate reductase-like glutaredoxin family protein
MKNSKCFSGTRCRRTLWIVGILVTVCSVGPTQADDTKLDDSAKKVGNNFGELLKGMGQEVKKVGKSDNAAEKKDKVKKDKKKETKSPEDEPDKNKENPR